MHGSRDHIVKFLVALALVLALPAGAQAADIAVETAADTVATDSSCSLREAVASANTDPAPGGDCIAGSGADVISLPAGTYTLNNAAGDLDVIGDTTFEGAGDATTIIDANNTDRAIDVPNTGGIAIDLAVRKLTLRNGNAIGATSDGGAIRMEETNGTLTIDQATIADSDAGRDGGAVSLKGVVTSFGAIATVVDSDLHGNTAIGDGGAVYFSMAFESSGAGHSLVIERSALTDNDAASNGGAIHAASNGYVETVNSTFSGNSAVAGGGAVSLGASKAKLDLRYSTVAGNTATAGAGGIQAEHDFASAVLLKGAIIAGNTAVNCAKVAPATGVFGSTSQGYNIESTNSCDLDAGTDLVSTDPQLQPLADNGGPTLTHNIAGTSPAHDRVDCMAGSAPAFDQRNFLRPVPALGPATSAPSSAAPTPTATASPTRPTTARTSPTSARRTSTATRSATPATTTTTTTASPTRPTTVPASRTPARRTSTATRSATPATRPTTGP